MPWFCRVPREDPDDPHAALQAPAPVSLSSKSYFLQ